MAVGVFTRPTHIKTSVNVLFLKPVLPAHGVQIPQLPGCCVNGINVSDMQARGQSFMCRYCDEEPAQGDFYCWRIAVFVGLVATLVWLLRDWMPLFVQRLALSRAIAA